MAKRTTNKRLSSAILDTGQTMADKMRNAKIRMSKDDRAKYSYLDGVSAEKHLRLLEILLQQVCFHNINRLERVRRFDRIVADIAVQQFISEDDNKAYSESKVTGLRNIRYPKTFGHLKDLTVNVMNTLFPMRQMYGSIAVTPTNQQLTTSFLQVLNRDAKRFKHFSAYYKAIFDGFAFNFGITMPEWEEVTGVSQEFFSGPVSPIGVSPNIPQRRILYQGGKIRYIDPYNAMFDETIPAEEFSTKGNFFAHVERASEYELYRLASEGRIILSKAVKDSLRTFENMFKEDAKSVNTQTWVGPNYYSLLANFPAKYSKASELVDGFYVNRPDDINDTIVTRKEVDKYSDDCGIFDYNRFISSNRKMQSTKLLESEKNNELLHVYSRINPKKLGLGEMEDATIYKFTILNGEYIVAMGPVSLSHGLMPVGITSPSVELGPGTTPSVASTLNPYQLMANSLMSAFVNQTLDNATNGGLAYDDRVNMAQAVKDKNGMIAVNMDNSGEGRDADIRRMFWQLQTNPPDGALLTAEAMLRDRVNDFQPTSSANQMANLNRPVNHQSRHLAMIMNMHTFITSRLISEQMVTTNNYMLARNTMAFGEPVEIINDNGDVETVSPQIFSNLDLSVIYSDGMKGLDTIALTERFDKMLNSMFQSPALFNRFDPAKMTSYLFQLEGADIDVDSFKYPDQFSALSPEQKQLAVELLQQLANEQNQPEA